MAIAQNRGEELELGRYLRRIVADGDSLVEMLPNTSASPRPRAETSSGLQGRINDLQNTHTSRRGSDFVHEPRRADEKALPAIPRRAQILTDT